MQLLDSLIKKSFVSSRLRIAKVLVRIYETFISPRLAFIQRFVDLFMCKELKVSVKYIKKIEDDPMGLQYPLSF